MMTSLGQVTRTTPELTHSPSQNHHTTPPRGFELDRFSVHQLHLHDRSSVAPGLEPVTRWPQVHDHNH
ncbi:hypothetical protein TNCV_5127471 [Trichonephila clavipes]|nr:hypothetical protein TNCV_5127471 [Trichonephila clavipes]